MIQLREQDDKALDDAIRNWAETSAKLSEAKKHLEELSQEASEIQSYVVQVMEQLGQEQRRVDNIVVKIKSKTEGGRVGYSKPFKFLLSKVNKQLQDAANEILESTRGDKWLKKWLVKEQREQLSEGIIKRIVDAITAAVDSLKARLDRASEDIDLLDRMEKDTNESTNYKGLADVMLESAIK